MSDDNQYASSALVGETVAEVAEPESPALRRLAARSWQYPLSGILFVLITSCLGGIHPAISLVGIFLFLLSLLAGFVLSIISLVYARKYRNLFCPAIAGLLCSTLLAMPFVVGLLFDLMRID